MKIRKPGDLWLSGARASRRCDSLPGRFRRSGGTLTRGLPTILQSRRALGAADDDDDRMPGVEGFMEEPPGPELQTLAADGMKVNGENGIWKGGGGTLTHVLCLRRGPDSNNFRCSRGC